jgi:hypothetical protein
LGSVFFAPYRQPVMHAPHCTQPVRDGPAPPKNGSSLTTPGPSPKKTPTGVRAKVCSTPICPATSRIASSLAVTVWFCTTPSICDASSKYGASSRRQSAMSRHCESS